MKYSICKICFLMFIALFVNLITAEEIGLRKSVVDKFSGMTFNNFRSDSSETVFLEVKFDRSMVYDAPKNNAELKYSLDRDMMVEFIEQGPMKKFIKIRFLEKGNDVIEGWIRRKDLSKMKYYGRSFLSVFENREEKYKIERTLIDPRWIKNDKTPSYSNASLNGDIKTEFERGELVFVDSVSEISSRVKYKGGDGEYHTAFVNNQLLSSFAMIKEASTDLETLYKMINPLVLIYDIDKSGFLSYSGLKISNSLKEGFNEDKICRDIGNDSLMYKFTFSDDVNNIQRKYEDINFPSYPSIAMYSLKDDEKIYLKKDTIDCKIVEIVHKPRSAKIILGDIEESTISNKISKLYVHYIKEFDMNVVWQKEIKDFHWEYKKNIKTGKYIEKKYKPETRLQRLIAFKKYDM